MTWRRHLIRSLPWVVALVLLAVVLRRVEPDALADALRNAAWVRYVSTAIVFSGAWLLLDAWVIARLVSRFHTDVPARHVLPLRGASYLLMAFSYDAAQAALGFALHRRFGIPVLAIGGTFAFYYGVDLLTIGILGSVGSALEPELVPATLALALPVFAVGVAIALGVAMVLARHRERAPSESRMSAFLETLRRARARDLMEFVGWRALFYASFIGFAALTLPTFGVTAPAPALLAIVPVVMSIGALPITVSGIGSTQLAMLLLYQPFGEESHIVAYSIVYSATLPLLRVPIGFVCLPWVRDIWPSSRQAQRS